MEIWLWYTETAINVPADSREWPSSTLIATRPHVRDLSPSSGVIGNSAEVTEGNMRRDLLIVDSPLMSFGSFVTPGYSTLLILRILLFPAANGGRGSPVFAGETDCTYYFDWDTAFACVKEKEDLLCQVSDKNKHYDLSPLTRFPGEVTCRQIFMSVCN